MIELSKEKRAAMLRGARCDLCPLAKDGIIVGPSFPKGKLRLIIVGEGPGRTEEKLGAPFVGMSGKVLDDALARNDVKRDCTYVTNAALCRGESDKDNDRAAECCAPRLLRELQELDPNVVLLTLGKNAARSVLGVRSILVARGFIWTAKEIDGVSAAQKKAWKVPEGPKREEAILKADTLAGRARLAGRKVVPTLHPAFILRADTWHPIFQIDVRRACRLAFGKIGALEDEGTHSVGGPEVLRGLGLVVSCDIETDGILPTECGMLCVGLSDGKKTAVVWPWRKRYAKSLSKVLASKEKVIFHNGWNFDLLVLRNHGVVW